MIQEIKVKPNTEQVAQLGKSVRELLFKNLPINDWCIKQAEKNKKIKL